MAKRKQEKGLKKEHLGLIIAGFGVLLLAGIAFAAGAGFLSFSGSAEKISEVDLNFTNVIANDGSAKACSAGTSTGTDGSTASVTDSDCEVLVFHAMLDTPGQTDTFKFKVTNVGSQTTYLEGLTSSYTTTDGVIVTWPSDMCGVSLAPGDTSNEYSITVQWQSTAFDNLESVGPFTAKVDYGIDEPDCD